MIIWNSVKLNMIERVVVMKTFILSKLYLLFQFFTVEDQFIKKWNKKIFNFIWNNNMELIKREVIYLPYYEGGLNMFCFESKILTITVQLFLFNTRRIEANSNAKFFFFFLYWNKFLLFRLNLPNFNVIPVGSDS